MLDFSQRLTMQLRSVASDKKTLANWHVENSEDIVQALGLMAGAVKYE